MCFKFFCFACAICQIMATYLQYLFTFRPQSFLAVWWDNVNFPLLISCFIYLYKNECVCMDIYADFYRVGGTGEWWWVCLNIYTVQETLIYKSNDSWICVCTRGNVYMYFGCLYMCVHACMNVLDVVFREANEACSIFPTEVVSYSL